MQSLEWYRNRLFRMSPGEIAHRAYKALRSSLEAAGMFTARSVPSPDWSARSQAWFACVADLDSRAYESAAESILHGNARVFATAIRGDRSSQQWNRDPLTGREAPLRFGKRIDYRNEDQVGNIKYLWEPNRHLELVTLAQAFQQTGHERYLQGIGERIESWLEQCPYPKGVNWASSLELGIRLINWSLCWQLIGQADSPLFAGDSGARLRERWLQSIYRHAHFIRNYYSRHSSANNHLIGEAAGVFIASCTWPYWRQFERWGSEARQILIDAARTQTHEDGVNREQAIAYQQFVLDFLVLAALAGEARNFRFPDGYMRTIERMIEFVQSIMDVAGNVPMFGDADDGFVVRLSQEPDFCPYKSLLATGAILFDRQDFAAKSGKLDDKTRMLLAGTRWNELRRPRQESSSAPRDEFPDGGYYILGVGREQPGEIRAVIDAGPLGYLSIAAHGHADALAVVLSVGGREFLIDPGTYSYHTKPEWREYFRGTGAHNTVRVDGLDQSVQGGNFMWLRHAQARCLEFRSAADGGVFAGEHDGYMRLPDPVLHRRTVRLDATRIEINDRLQCDRSHEIERCWHFSEHCRVSESGNAIVAEQGPVRVTLRVAEPGCEIRRVRGSTEPPGGWVSRRFDEKSPADSIYFVNEIRGTIELKTLITWRIGPESAADED